MEGAIPMTKTKFSPFDVADPSKTPHDAAHYLDVALADGDANEIAEALGVVARSQPRPMIVTMNLPKHRQVSHSGGIE